MTNQESYRAAFDHIKAPESITADRIRKIAAQRIGKESTMDMETGTASENKLVSMDASAGKLHRSHRKAVRALRPLIAAAAEWQAAESAMPTMSAESSVRFRYGHTVR